MIVRALDTNGDWTFGKGKNDYKSGLDAVSQMIKTRLKSFLGDCFFDTTSGIDWFTLLGSFNSESLKLAVATTILNTENVTGLLELSVNLDALRQIKITYQVQTTLGDTGDIYQYDVNALI